MGRQRRERKEGIKEGNVGLQKMRKTVEKIEMQFEDLKRIQEEE